MNTNCYIVCLLTFVKVKRNAAFNAVVASTQRESFCEAKGSFTIGFLEKTVSDWWSKYVIVIS